jgi:hypothetical protein
MRAQAAKWLREIFGSAVGTILADTLQQLRPVSPPRSADRALLFVHIQALPEDAAKILWERHREAGIENREHRFVQALSQIPADVRREALLGLAKVGKAEFEQALSLLNPEQGGFVETLKRIDKSWDEKLRAENDRLEEELSRLRRERHRGS